MTQIEMHTAFKDTSQTMTSLYKVYRS